MMPLKCDFCNGSLVMDKSGEFAVCEYCNMKYTKETIQIKLSGTVEVVVGDAEKERILQNAETNIRLKEFMKAKDDFESVTESFPSDWRGYWGLYRLPFEAFLSGEAFFEPDMTCFRHAIELYKDQNTDLYVFTDFFNRVANFHGTSPLVNQKESHLLRKTETIFDISSGTKRDVYNISIISKWFITEAFEVFSLLNDSDLLEYSQNIKNNYLTILNKGQIAPLVFYSKPFEEPNKTINGNARSFITRVLKKSHYKQKGTRLIKGNIALDLNPNFEFRIDWITKHWIQITEGYYDLDRHYLYVDNIDDLIEFESNKSLLDRLLYN